MSRRVHARVKIAAHRAIVGAGTSLTDRSSLDRGRIGSQPDVEQCATTPSASGVLRRINSTRGIAASPTKLSSSSAGNCSIARRPDPREIGPRGLRTSNTREKEREKERVSSRYHSLRCSREDLTGFFQTRATVLAFVSSAPRHLAFGTLTRSNCCPEVIIRGEISGP